MTSNKKGLPGMKPDSPRTPPKKGEIMNENNNITAQAKAQPFIKTPKALLSQPISPQAKLLLIYMIDMHDEKVGYSYFSWERASCDLHIPKSTLKDIAAKELQDMNLFHQEKQGYKSVKHKVLNFDNIAKLRPYKCTNPKCPYKHHAQEQPQSSSSEAHEKPLASCSKNHMVVVPKTISKLYEQPLASHDQDPGHSDPNYTDLEINQSIKGIELIEPTNVVPKKKEKNRSKNDINIGTAGKKNRSKNEAKDLESVGDPLILDPILERISATLQANGLQGITPEDYPAYRPLAAITHTEWPKNAPGSFSEALVSWCAIPANWASMRSRLISLKEDTVANSRLNIAWLLNMARKDPTGPFFREHQGKEAIKWWTSLQAKKAQFPKEILDLYKTWDDIYRVKCRKQYPRLEDHPEQADIINAIIAGREWDDGMFSAYIDASLASGQHATLSGYLEWAPEDQEKQFKW